MLSEWFSTGHLSSNATYDFKQYLTFDSVPDNIDQTHGRVGLLAHAEGDVNVQVGQDAALLAVNTAPGTRVVTHRKLTLWTRVSSPPSQTITTLGRRLEVGTPDCWLFQ